MVLPDLTVYGLELGNLVQRRMDSEKIVGAWIPPKLPPGHGWKLSTQLETPQPRYPTSDRIFLGFSIPEYGTIHGTASQKPFFSGSLALPHPHVQQFDRFPEDFWGLPTVSVFTAITLD